MSAITPPAAPLLSSGHTERLTTALADRYRIERTIGAGGMATVFVAHDLKHDRKVAVKVLKPELSAVLGADRFVVEIRTTASLQHPHILPLFDSGSADGLLYYVMPFVEGETLRAKLSRETQLNVDEAIGIARDVADALDYAHRRGVVHRDIKPENILLQDGRPLVADFGIALAVSAAAGGRMTETGLSLGTPHYMSPEQATADKDITARSDIYSIGSVLYEMLTGNPPHVGASAQQIIMKIITDDAEPVTKFRKTVPPHVAAAVAKSLEKLPADRFDSARAFAEALANPAFATASTRTTTAGSRASLSNVPLIAAATVAVVASIAAVWGWSRPSPAREVSRFGVILPDSQPLSESVNGTRVAISPDGRAIAYVGRLGTGSGTALFVRWLDDLRATPLPGTDRAANPSFSPDGKQIAFTTAASPRALKVIPVAGGPALTLTDSLVDLGGLSWGYDGYIYYDGHLEGDGIARIRESGGKPERASIPNAQAGESYHFMPAALPDGHSILMSITRGGSAADIAALDTRTGKYTPLVRGLVGRYAASGHLVYVTDAGMLMAAPFDLKHLRVTGDAVLLADGIAVRGNQRVDVAIAPNGTLVYAAGNTFAGTRELVWITRSGVATPVDPAWNTELSLRAALSPDGRSVAVTVGRGPGRQIWVKALDRGPATKVAEQGNGASWLPDGRTLVFTTPQGAMTVPADGSALPSLLLPKDSLLRRGANYSVSHDGRWIIFQFRGDVYAERSDGDTTARVVVSDVNNQVGPALSPDGRWLAYASDESGEFQVYVRPFPNTATAKRQVSVASGFAARWSRDGRALFYVDRNGGLWAVDVAPGPVFATGTPRLLFAADAYGPANLHQFDIAPDGRFLFTRAIGANAATTQTDQMVVVENFFEELRTKVNAKK